jgi:hypothetical protein
VAAGGLVAAAIVPRALDLDPFTVRASVVPFLALAGCALVLLALWVLRRSDLVVGAAAGVVAGTVALGLQQILYGTPYAPGGLAGDIGRYTALATRYTVRTASSDGVIPGAPSEYPPLIPWLIGKAAVLLDRPAWTLVAWAMTILTALAVVGAFWLWNRVTSAPVALALAALPMAVFAEPGKAFHLVALALLAPWVIVTFTDLPRAAGGLHWAWAGAVGALQVLVYPGYLVFAALGIAAVVVRAWWRSERRAAYVRHLVGTAVVALVVVSWYLVPFLVLRRSFSTGSVSDHYESSSLNVDPAHLLPQVLAGHPVLIALWLFGAVSLAWWASRGRTWAWVMAALVVGAYVYRVLRLVGFLATGGTGFLQYTSRLIDVVLCSAAVLGAAEAIPAAARRLRVGVPVAVGVVLVLLVTTMAPVSYLVGNRLPTAVTSGSLASLQAHIEPLPDCTLPRFSPTPAPKETAPPAPLEASDEVDLAFTPVPCFPAAAVHRAVDDRLGANALPVTVSYSERLWAFYPWYAFITNARSAAGLFQNYDARLPVLQSLARVDDPGRLAAAMSSTPFGPIDVLVLRGSGAELSWVASGQDPATVTFRRSQFSGPQFAVADVGQRTTVVVRTGAVVAHAPYPR